MSTALQVDPALAPRPARPTSDERERARRRRLRKRRAILLAVLVPPLLVTIFPVYFVILAALDPTSTLATPSLLPRRFSLVNFENLFSGAVVLFWQWFRNSLAVSLSVAAISVIITAMAAYSFSRFRFKGRRPLMKVIVLVQVFPNLLALVAIYLMIQELGRLVPALGLNSLIALSLVYLGGVLGGSVWLMKGYLDALPRELDESAMIDGASHVMIFWRILMPLCKPILAVVAVLSFVGTYSEVLLARVLITDSAVLTLPVGLYTSSQSLYSTSWGTFAAGSLIAALPAVVLFYFLQGWLIQGLTSGSVKA